MKLPPRSFQEAITTFEDEEEESHAPINVSKVRSTIPDRSLQPYVLNCTVHFNLTQ